MGGVIRCTVSGLPAGLGGPDWRDTVEGTIARHVFAIPAVKAIGFGAGETFAQMRGSAANDPFTMAVALFAQRQSCRRCQRRRHQRHGRGVRRDVPPHTVHR